MPMDVRGILQTQADELLDVDLDCLEDELLLGEHDVAYNEQCQKLIDDIRRRRSRTGSSVVGSLSTESAGTAKSEDASAAYPGGTVFVSSDNLSPFNEGKAKQAVSPSEAVARDLAVLRRSPKEEKDFETYLEKATNIDEPFVDRHIDLFNEEELRVIVRKLPLSEQFLEKYFDVLDHRAVSEYQCFSEEFFIKHFSELDATAVLRRGPNEWRSKEKRSSKLDVFLRLKGIRI